MNTLTPEEKKQQAKEKKRIYQREYMKKRRETDPEFAEKQRECRKKCEKTRYDTDPEYRTKKSNENKERYAKYREAYLQNL